MGMMVSGTRSFSPDVGKAVMDQTSDEVIDDAVVALASVFTGRHELEVSKKGELMTHRGHREPESMGEVTDAKLFMGERVHQAEPKRVRQGEEDLDGFRGGILRRKARTELLDLLFIDDVRQTRSHT